MGLSKPTRLNVLTRETTSGVPGNKFPKISPPITNSEDSEPAAQAEGPRPTASEQPEPNTPEWFNW